MWEQTEKLKSELSMWETKQKLCQNKEQEVKYSKTIFMHVLCNVHLGHMSAY